MRKGCVDSSDKFYCTEKTHEQAGTLHSLVNFQFRVALCRDFGKKNLAFLSIIKGSVR